MTLYELTEEYRQLLALAEDPDTDDGVFADTLEGLTGEIEDKAEGYAIVIKEIEAQHDKFTKEIKRLVSCCDSLKGRVDRMKAALKTTMETMGVQKLQTEHFKVGVVKNGGVMPLKITAEVPQEYMKYTPTQDNAKIREALDNGVELPFAHYEERGTHLSIR